MQVLTILITDGLILNKNSSNSNSDMNMNNNNAEEKNYEIDNKIIASAFFGLQNLNSNKEVNAFLLNISFYLTNRTNKI